MQPVHAARDAVFISYEKFRKKSPSNRMIEVDNPSSRTGGRSRGKSLIPSQGYSGIEMSSKWILAHGSLLAPILKSDRALGGFVANLPSGEMYVFSAEFSNLFPLFVYRESPAGRDPSSPAFASWHSPILLGDSLVEETHGRVGALWKCPLLTATLESRFLDGWLLEHPGQSADGRLLPLIVLVERREASVTPQGTAAGILLRSARLTTQLVEPPDRQENLNRLNQSTLRIPSNRESARLYGALKEFSQRLTLPPPVQGATAEIVSTPFGNPVFLGTLSRGVIANVLGRKDCLFLTDAPAFPGAEGAPLYATAEPGAEQPLSGMVIASSCWCRGERTDYNFALNLPASFEEILKTGKDSPIAPRLSHDSPTSPDALAIGCTTNNAAAAAAAANERYPDGDQQHLWSVHSGEYLGRSLVVVRCGQNWGTATLIDDRTGTFLTCAHVLSEAPNKDIRITSQLNEREHTVAARLIYKTAPNQPYDVALFTVLPHHLNPALRAIKMANRSAFKGEDVLSVGFPFFWQSRPTVSSGIVSRSLDCMLQTSCCVQSGASGGPIVTRDGHEMLGMIVCNVVAANGTVLYPRLSMAVPLTVLKGPLIKYFELSDPRELKVLYERDSLIQRIWKLHPILLTSNM